MTPETLNRPSRKIPKRILEPDHMNRVIIQSVYILWPRSAHQRNAIWLAFRWQADCGPLCDAFWVLHRWPAKALVRQNVSSGETTQTSPQEFIRSIKLSWIVSSVCLILWLSGRVLHFNSRRCGFEPHRRHCVVSLSFILFFVLVLPRNTPSFHDWKIVDFDVLIDSYFVVIFLNFWHLMFCAVNQSYRNVLSQRAR